MKRAFYIGVIIGGVSGIAVALGMDLLLGPTLGGGWGVVVANDLNRLFDANFLPNDFIVIIGIIVVVGIIGAFGAFIGGFFGVIIGRLFSMLTKDDH